MFAKIPPMDTGAEATRASGYKVIQKIAEMVPTYISGSADLHGSTRNYIDGGENFGAGFDKSYAGKVSFFLYFFWLFSLVHKRTTSARVTVKCMRLTT